MRKNVSIVKSRGIKIDTFLRDLGAVRSIESGKGYFYYIIRFRVGFYSLWRGRIVQMPSLVILSLEQIVARVRARRLIRILAPQKFYTL